MPPVGLVNTDTSLNSNRSAAANAVPSHSQLEDSPQSLYEARTRRFGEQAQVLRRGIERFSWLRVIIALGVVYAIYRLAMGATDDVWRAVFGVCLAAFAGLVFHHRTLKAKLATAEAMAVLNEEATARLTRDWARLRPWRGAARLENPAWSTSLNILGHASLFHLLGSVATARGQAMLLEWLGRPAVAGVVKARQEAVQELAGELDFRQALYGLVDGLAEDEGDERLIRWAEARPPDAGLPSWMVGTLTVLGLGLLALGGAGMVPPELALVGLGINALVSLKYLPAVHTELSTLEESAPICRRYAVLVDFISARPAQSSRLKTLRETLGSSGALRGLRTAQRLIHFADLRHGGLFYVVMQVLTLWSFHVHTRLRVFKNVHGAQLRTWLDAGAEVEVLASLATLAFDHPDWCFPRIEPGAQGVSAGGLGHPLLPPDRRVDNDVCFGEGTHTLFLLTGSNMSGKSTLLRSIGTNILLAATGAPVCARQFTMPPVSLHLCFGSQDSLVDGVSLFMAELRCLDAVRKRILAARAEGRVAVFLLDEILRGTNSRDRHQGAARVLRHLLSAGGTGVVATHDLALAELPALRPYCTAWHFGERVEQTTQGTRLRHDYRLCPGVANTTNALHLLEETGFTPIIGE